MEMTISTKIEDFDVIEDLDTLYYSVEIGELYERDKFKWSERTDFDVPKKKKLEFGFKMNHIKQVIKVELQGSYINRRVSNEVIQKSIFIGFFNFARCVRKSGHLIQPQQIGVRLSEYIDVQVGLKEKYKFGGYRCITLKAFDTKGGDFIENPDLSVLVLESKRNTVVTEIPKDLPLIQSPDGFYKRIEIGVNNYSPQQFMNQHFKVYFVKDSQDYSKYLKGQDSNLGIFEPINEMRSEQDILQERIQNDLKAFGEFSAQDLIDHSVNKDDFLVLEPQQEQSRQASQRTNSVKNMYQIQDEEDEASEYKLPLFSREKNQQIGLMTLRNIQCKKRTSFLDLIANQMLEIVPIIAVDFSMSNLTFDERKCIHSVNEDNPNEYRDLIAAISKAYRQISPSSLLYGFGANSVLKKTEVSDLFVGTGDLLNPIVMTDHLEQTYYSCLKRVELNLPVHISKVVEKSIEFAQQSELHFLTGDRTDKVEYKHGLTYFVLYILNTGVIDDISETIQQLARVINLPLSIYIVNLQNKNLRKDDIDASQLEDKCKFLFERGNRKFLKVMEYADLGFQSHGYNEVIHKLTERIPFEIEQYFDTVAAHTQIHIQQNQVRKGLDLVREVLRQKEEFLDSIEGVEGLTREKVNKLIEEFQLYEYSAESAQILLGLKKRVDKS